MANRLLRWVADRIDPERRSAVLGITPRLDPSGMLNAFQGRQTAAKVAINPATALGIAAFRSCVELISSLVAAARLEIGLSESGIDFLPTRDDPRYLLLWRRPNPWIPKFKLWQTVVSHSILYPGGFLEIEETAHAREAERYALGLHLMDPRTTRPVVNPDRSVEYQYNAKGDKLPARSVVHVRNLSWDGIQGYDLVGQAAEILGVARAQLLYEGSVYGNGAQKGITLEVPGNLNGKQESDLRVKWNSTHQGPGNANKVAILSGGMKAVDTTYSPADAEMTTAQQAKAVEIATLLRVPPHMIGLRSETVGNAEQQMLEFLNTNLMPRFEDIQGELDLKLLSRQEQARGVCTRHDPSNLLRADSATRIAYYQGRFGLASITPDEVRQREGDKPFNIPQSRVAYLETNNKTRLDKVGDEPTQPVASQAKGTDDGGQSGPEEPQADRSVDATAPTD